MVFPGLKKLGKYFGFKNDGTVFYGFHKNSYVTFWDGANQKIVEIAFPAEPDTQDQERILQWKKRGYAKEILLISDDCFHVQLIFTEHLIPFKVEKIKEIIEDLTGWFASKYPEGKIKCFGKDCTSQSEGSREIYQVSNFPVPLCPDCASKINSMMENSKEEEKLTPNNYYQGTIFALIFSIPGIFVTFGFFLLGRIVAISGLLYFWLAQKGYSFAKGKQNKTGVAIVSAVSVFFTIFGTWASYVAYVVKEIMADPEFPGHPLTEIISLVVNLTVSNPQVSRELFSNILISLLLCALCIVPAARKEFKNLNNGSIKKL